MSSFSVTKCPRCEREDASVLVGQRATCPHCSKCLRRVYQFCWGCRREWPKGQGDSCILPACGLRAALLSTQLIGGHSEVRDCPLFRACPGCKALVSHTGRGCPLIQCPQCHLEFCYRCLKKSFDDDYDSDSSDDDDDDDDDDEEYFDFSRFDSCERFESFFTTRCSSGYCIGICEVVDNTESLRSLDQDGQMSS